MIVVSFFLPACFKYYLQFLIGTSVNSDILWRYLIFGLIYLIFVFNRGLPLSIPISQPSPFTARSAES